MSLRSCGLQPSPPTRASVASAHLTPEDRIASAKERLAMTGRGLRCLSPSLRAERSNPGVTKITLVSSTRVGRRPVPNSHLDRTPRHDLPLMRGERESAIRRYGTIVCCRPAAHWRDRPTGISDRKSRGPLESNGLARAPISGQIVSLHPSALQSLRRDLWQWDKRKPCQPPPFRSERCGGSPARSITIW